MPARNSPKPADVAIGGRIRAVRMRAGISQEKLGERIGVTFQQVQKYEKGTNRVGGSRMGEIAAALDVSVATLHGENEAAGRIDAVAGFDRLDLAIAREAAGLTAAQKGAVLNVIRALRAPATEAAAAA